LDYDNLKSIRYKLAEDNFAYRRIEVDSDNYFIEAASDDLVTFSTQSASPFMEGFYWGRGLGINGEASDSDYSYTSKDTVKVSNGVALDSLELDRFPMYAAYITNIEDKVFTIESIHINGADAHAMMSGEVNHERNLNLAQYTNFYMSYNSNIIKNIEYSVVVRTSNGSTTLTASVDLSKDNKLLIDGSIIK
jgi:hypothetical protein